MRAVRVDRAGGPEELHYVRIDRPTAAAGEVLVRLEASGVNYADILCRKAAHPGMPQPPLVPGCEGAGVVEVIAEGVTRHRVGDRVAVYSPPGGTYAEWVAVPENYALPLPAGMSFPDAAAFTHVYLTAYHALRVFGGAREGEWLFVSAAAGGVGTAIVQLAQSMGLHVIGGVGTPEKFALLRELGVEHLVDYERQSLSEAVRAITCGRGADVVLDSVGGHVFDEAARCLAPRGRLVLFGVASGVWRSVDPSILLATSSTFAALNLSVLFAHFPGDVRGSWRELLDLYADGAIRPVIRYRLPLARAAEAHRLMESRETVGKLILTPEPEPVRAEAAAPRSAGFRRRSR